jgi:hypothetical protein
MSSWVMSWVTGAGSWGFSLRALPPPRRVSFGAGSFAFSLAFS